MVIVDDPAERPLEDRREAALKWYSDLFGVPVEAFVSVDGPTFTYEPTTALPALAEAYCHEWLHGHPPHPNDFDGLVTRVYRDIDDGDQDTRL